MRNKKLEHGFKAVIDPFGVEGREGRVAGSDIHEVLHLLFRVEAETNPLGNASHVLRLTQPTSTDRFLRVLIPHSILEAIMPYICSSNASEDNGDIAFEIAEDGAVLNKWLSPDWDSSMPVRFDTAEFVHHYGELCDTIDILDIGFWDDEGDYVPPEPEVRQMIFDEYGLGRNPSANSEDCHPAIVINQGEN